MYTFLSPSFGRTKQSERTARQASTLKAASELMSPYSRISGCDKASHFTQDGQTPHGCAPLLTQSRLCAIKRAAESRSSAEPPSISIVLGNDKVFIYGKTSFLKLSPNEEMSAVISYRTARHPPQRPWLRQPKPQRERLAWNRLYMLN